MTPETIEPILAAISGGAVTIAREMAWKASTASILLLLISVLAWWFSSRTESEDAELVALLVMVACGVGSILCVIRAAFIYMTPHISAINYLSGVLK
jgi:hypothetical protein